jgi:hypothetical protein
LTFPVRAGISSCSQLYPQILTIGDAFIASRLELPPNASDKDYHEAAVATCHVGLNMQAAMTDLQSRGVFRTLPGGTMKIRVGLHTGPGYGFMTGQLNLIIKKSLFLLTD